MGMGSDNGNNVSGATIESVEYGIVMKGEDGTVHGASIVNASRSGVLLSGKRNVVKNVTVFDASVGVLFQADPDLQWVSHVRQQHPELAHVPDAAIAGALKALRHTEERERVGVLQSKLGSFLGEGGAVAWGNLVLSFARFLG
jgi:hypothetical protein